MAGIRTPDLPQKTNIDEFIGNTNSGSGMETVRATAAAVAAELAVATGRAFNSWAALNITTGAFAGERAEVYGDTGVHTDPVVGGTVANAGVYGWSAAPAGWLRVSALDIAGIDARLIAETADRVAADTAEANLRLTKDDDLQSQVSALAGSLIADGSWDASANSPTLASGVGTQGHYRIVSTAGTTSLDGISSWSVGDWALFSAGAWKNITGQTVVNKLSGALSNPQLLIDLPTSGVEAGGPPFRMSYSAGFISDGGIPPTYYDHVVQLGWNVAPGGGKVIPTEPAWSIAFESKFRNGGTGVNALGCEWHMRMHDMNNNELRPISIWCAHNGGRIELSHRTSNYTILTAGGNLMAQMLLNETGGSQWNWGNSGRYMQFVFNQNNHPPVTMYNAAGNAALSLPYYDNNDILFIGGPAQFTAAIAPSTGAAWNSYIAWTAYGAAWKLQGTAVTGQIWGFRLFLNATGEAANFLQNQNTTSATAHAVDHLKTAGSGSGDPFIRWEIEGVTSWSAGLDNSDGDKWKLSHGAALGSGDVIKSDGVSVEFIAPPKLPSLTVAQANTLGAATVGAGSMIFVSNESGGPVVAYSDGAYWKRVTDGAPIS